MPKEDEPIDKLKNVVESFPDRAFGYVIEWTATGRNCRIKFSDKEEWNLCGEDRINRFRAVLDFSKDEQSPIFLAVNKKIQDIGMIFSTMSGVPEFNGESTDRKRLQISVPPSPRVFQLQKDRPWFDAVKNKITAAQKPVDPKKPQKLRISFDSETSEIVDIRDEMK